MQSRLSSWRAAMSTTSSFRPKMPRAPIRIIWSRSRKAVVAAGARTVNLPDTVGFSVPDEYGATDRPHREGAGRLAPSSACIATTTWAWRSRTRSPRCRAGARQIECTINGIGERAGNCCAGRGRDGDQDAQRPPALPHRHSDRASLSGQPVAVEHHHASGRSRTKPSSARTRSRTRRASTRTDT